MSMFGARVPEEVNQPRGLIMERCANGSKQNPGKRVVLIFSLTTPLVGREHRLNSSVPRGSGTAGLAWLLGAWRLVRVSSRRLGFVPRRTRPAAESALFDLTVQV